MKSYARAGTEMRGQTPVGHERDGGHGMLFRKLDGSLALTLHQPNRTPHERARFFDIEEADGSLRIR